MNNAKRRVLSLCLVLSQVSPATAEMDNAFQFFQEEAKVITASKSLQNLSDAPGVMSVVTKDELERFGGATLADILRRVPGLAGASSFMTDRSMIAVRGAQFKASGAHVLLLINGRPVREIMEGGIVSDMLESFPVNIIQRIEVVKGPGSVLYGSGAVSGVINVITERPEGTGAAVDALKGDKGAADAMAKAQVRSGDFGMLAAGKFHQKPEWNTRWNAAGLSGLTSRRINMPDRGPGAFTAIDYKNWRVMSAYSEWHNAFFIPGISTPGPANWKKRFADAGYSRKVNDLWRMDLNVTYTGSDFNTETAWPHVERHSYELGGEWTHFITPTDKLAMAVGGSVNHANGREEYTGAPGFQISHGDRNSYGLYTQMDYWLLSKLKLIGGFQFNKVQGVDADAVPRGGAIFHPAPHVHIKALYGQAFRAPSINELGLNHPGLKGNPNLKSEKIDTFDLAIGYDRNNLQLGLDYFYSKLKNLIFQDRSGAVGVYNNTGEIEARGVGIESKYRLNRRLLLLASALYQTSQDQTGGTAVTPVASAGGKAGASYKADRGVTVSLYDIYQGKLDGKYDASVNPSPGAYNILNLNSRFDMDKLTGWRLARGLSLLFRVDNLSNQEIWLPNWGFAPGDSLPVNQGRTLYGGVEVSF